MGDFFDDVDTDDDRRISLKELLAACETGSIKIAKPEQVFEDMDTNSGGQVLFDEFCVYVANEYIDSAELDAAFVGTKAAGKPPRKIGRRKKRKSKTGRKTTDTDADITTKKFDKAEAVVLKNINNKEYLNAIWRELDYNGNKKV